MMRWICVLLVLVVMASLVSGRQADVPAAAATQAAGPRFAHLDVYVDAKRSALGAYQFEFAAEGAKVTLVGIEGGEHAAFARTPPYYDPAALGQGRVIVAAFSMDAELPKGRTRVARLHVMVEGAGEPQYAAKLVAAADAGGKRIDGATVSVLEGVRP